MTRKEVAMADLLEELEKLLSRINIVDKTTTTNTTKPNSTSPMDGKVNIDRSLLLSWVQNQLEIEFGVDLSEHYTLIDRIVQIWEKNRQNSEKVRT